MIVEINREGIVYCNGRQCVGFLCKETRCADCPLDIVCSAIMPSVID